MLFTQEGIRRWGGSKTSRKENEIHGWYLTLHVQVYSTTTRSIIIEKPYTHGNQIIIRDPCFIDFRLWRKFERPRDDNGYFTKSTWKCSPCIINFRNFLKEHQVMKSLLYFKKKLFWTIRNSRVWKHIFLTCCLFF